MAENDAALVFYRDNSGIDKNAVNINLNDEYLTSLQQNGFKQITTCAMPQRIGAFVTGTDNQYLRKAGQGDFFNPANPRTYTLDASALFQFDQSGAGHILPKGREEIAAIARDIREYPVAIRAIEVVGHTDPQGDAGYNQRLSAARAQTVGNLLVQSGAPANLISARGMGESQPVVANCAQQHKGNREAINACNQPNRRVEVKLHAQQ